MRRAIGLYSIVPRASVSTVPIMMRMVSTVPESKTSSPMNFDGHFHTFNTIYAPAAKTVVKNWKDKWIFDGGFWAGSTYTYGDIDEIAKSLASVRNYNRFPITFGEESSDRRFKEYMEREIWSIHRLSHDLNYIFTLFGEGKLNSLLQSSDANSIKKMKLFQYSLFHLATSFETELLGRKFTKPGSLVAKCYWPEEFYGREIIEEFRAQHSGLLLINQNDFAIDMIGSANPQSTTDLKSDVKSNLDCEKLFEIFTRFYIPRMGMRNELFYRIDRFCSIVRFLLGSYLICGKHPLKSSLGVEYYKHILANLTSNLDSRMRSIAEDRSNRYHTISHSKNAEAFMYSMWQLAFSIESEIFGNKDCEKLSEICKPRRYAYDVETIREFNSKVNEGYDNRLSHRNFIASASQW